MALLFSKYFISAAIITVIYSLDFEQRCSQFNNSFYHGSSCFIGIPDPKTQTAAMATCNDMGKGGHLAFIGSQQTMDKLVDLGNNIINGVVNTFKLVWVGLAQKDPSAADEPDGKWSWIHPDGRFWTPNDHRILRWYPNRPDNLNNAWEGCLDLPTGKVADCWDNNSTFEYICEYENSQKLYKEHATNKVGNNLTKIQETVERHIGKCAIQCSKELPCRAYSYNENNGSCILHYLTSNGYTGYEPEDHQGYIMFDSYY